MPFKPVTFLESAVSSEPLVPSRQCMMASNASKLQEAAPTFLPPKAGHKSDRMPVKRLVPVWCSVPVTPSVFRIPL
eukprot:12058516-Alexandrium_andersonii.AAC.1